MTHFPGFPSLIFQGMGAGCFPHCGMVTGQIQTGENDTEHLSMQICLLISEQPE